MARPVPRGTARADREVYLHVTTALLLLLVGLLAFSNGANDNFKGVATIYGSGLASYRASLAWATVATLAGSLLALTIASQLVDSFSGRGLVPDALVGSPSFLAAVALGGGAAVLLATRLGLPVSTTHALVGALTGAGLVAAGADLRLGSLGATFFVPLALGPVFAMLLTGLAYPLARETRRSLPALNAAHFISGGAVSFARGLNDTPKIAALLIGGGATGASASAGIVAFAIAAGGVLGARRVAETMGRKVTELTPGQGLVANLGAAVLVAGASGYGLPVSTTHVTNGGLFAIGAITGHARWRTIGTIVAAWATTLPMGMALGALAYLSAGAVS